MSVFVSICIATYQRPTGLKRLLLGLNQLTFDAVALPTIELVVIDNDAAGSARSLCEELRSQLRWTLKYEIEPQPGVTYARNRSLAIATEQAQFVAIIDDDEVPSPQWLDELLHVQAQFDAEVVTGPVYPHFEDCQTPAWIKKGQFFEPGSYETGHLLQVAFTNNVLIRKDCLQGMNPVFDHRFAVRGAEDSHLFMRLARNRCKIVWAKTAAVVEWVPASRTNLTWLVKRNFWGWSSYSLFEKEIFASSTGQLLRSVKGLGLIAAGLASLPFALLGGRIALVKSILSVCRGAGTFAGLIGFQGQW